MKLPYYLFASALCLSLALGACSDAPTDVASEVGSADSSSLNKKKDENGGENVDLCHATHYTDDDTNSGLFEEGDPAFVWISVDPRAVNKHKNKHGDGERVDGTYANPSSPPPSSDEYCDRDDDVDGIADDADNCVETPNNDQANSDTDSFGDACDNCVAVDNEDQANSDTDSWGDACDNCVAVDNEDQANSDTDLLGDACDNCVAVDNNDQANSDTDLYGDACDNCATVDNNDQANSDTDALGDACDNCQFVDNNDQADFDGDLIGDACDSDIDNDGIDNGDDDCPYEGPDNCEGSEVFDYVLGCCYLE